MTSLRDYTLTELVLLYNNNISLYRGDIRGNSLTGTLRLTALLRACVFGLQVRAKHNIVIAATFTD